jgi:hypothetical protein
VFFGKARSLIVHEQMNEGKQGDEPRVFRGCHLANMNWPLIYNEVDIRPTADVELVHITLLFRFDVARDF